MRQHLNRMRQFPLQISQAADVVEIVMGDNDPSDFFERNAGLLYGAADQ